MNSISKLPLNITPLSPIPINVQLKEQLLCLIGSGAIKPGDFLPSANELADQVSLNRNTINAIYNQLAKEGVVVVKKGSGTQVLDTGRIANDRETLSFIDSKMKEAVQLQINLQELPVAYLIFEQIYEAVSEKSKHLLFVSFRTDDFATYSDEIKSVKTSSITQITFHQLKQLERPALEQLLHDIDIVVTPYSGLKEIHNLELPASKRIIAVGDIPY
ncbi:GntR family transcriptional regulator [Cohnella abietis]|uniref:HTH gntR-type domain-containing protein n=1 Tax=Cohnella abietis TaxID=2507935 RepID=A0A3T1DBQ0_9BACL|nr:GntR family transcriptional regulator [Cohnella abietis]BBI35519.1 hypothetical protein KCTCHS21_49180 [Cohnella abietis]